MRRNESERKAREKYGNCRLHYKITPESCAEKNNLKNLDKMITALENVGVWLRVNNNELSLSIYPEGYSRAKSRNAGRKKISVLNNEKNGFQLYKYADIVFLMQTMTDQQIYEKIKMKPATYYRHKKVLRESDYYASLDFNKLDDSEYLNSVPGNFPF